MDEQLVCSWGYPLRAFGDKLRELRDHMAEHDMYVGVEDDVADIDHCLELIAVVDEDSGWEDDHWDELWDFVKLKMRAWWD